MTTVCCVWVEGEYPYAVEYVTRLRAMVARWIDRPFRFVCLTDRPALLPNDMDRIRVEKLPGFAPWTKLEVFNPARAWEGRVLYLDLDSLIVAPLAPILDCGHPFAITADPERPGQRQRDAYGRWIVRRFNSSVMVWDGATTPTFLRTMFQPWVSQRLSGDQDWIGEQFPTAMTLPRAWFPRISEAVRPPWDPAAKVILVKVPKNHILAESEPWVEAYWGGGVMGASWTAALPRVTVERTGTPKPVTFVYPFYENDAFLQQQVALWRSYPLDLARNLTVIVVDDGSRGPGPAPAFAGGQAFGVRLFRIAEDVRWNWLAARNIGAHAAAPGWLLLTDMDHMVPPATLAALVYGVHDPRVVYAFTRRDHSAANPIAPHKNSWFLTRERYWAVGGYDETLSGYYGTDGDWRRRCAAAGPMAVLTDRLIRHEFVEDSSTRTYGRKEPRDEAVPRLIAARGAGWRPKALSFPYREVAVC